MIKLIKNYFIYIFQLLLFIDFVYYFKHNVFKMKNVIRELAQMINNQMMYENKRINNCIEN